MYQCLKLRQDVFIIEQACIYPDIDDYDPHALHVVGLDHHSQLVAYARVVPPGRKFKEPAVGRVVVAPSHRGAYVGHDLMTNVLKYCDEHYPAQENRISAQSHLSEFYASFGYKVVSEEYLEDGIPHVEMLRSAA